MKKNNLRSVFYFLLVGALLFFAKGSYANPEFPRNEYQRIERSALSNGYGDIASSMALLYRYRESLDRCETASELSSALAFAEFLDSFIKTVNQYMNTSGIWRPAVRSSAEYYVANASVLIQLYLEKKIAKFGPGALDQEVLEMCPKMHSRLAQLLRVGANSESSLKQKWESAKIENFLADAQWGKAAKSIRQLALENESVCRTP